MRNTDDPLAYVFAKPDAKRILYALASEGPAGYESMRVNIGLESQTFYRITRRLSQFALIHMRAPREKMGANRRIRVEMVLSKSGARIVPVLKELDRVIKRNRDGLASRTVSSLLV